MCILLQLPLVGIVGLATAFVPSFEVYMVLRFAVASASAGWMLSTIALSEYLDRELSIPVCGPETGAIFSLQTAFGDVIKGGIYGQDRNRVARCCPPSASASLPTVSEWVGPSWRTRTIAMMQAISGLGQMALAGLAYGIRNWRYLQIAISAPTFLLFFYFW